jgi:osmoprotectant transport system ATP-binding protein
MTPGEPVIEFNNVSYRIAQRDILQNISFAISGGETLVLLGRSGCGKTTVLRLILKLLQPTAGEVRFEGRPTASWDPIRLRRRIGYVIQDVGLFPHWSVGRNVRLVPALEGWPEHQAHSRANQLLAQVGLDPNDFGERYPRQLSGGQKQRVGIARALAADPHVLLLDEPFGALDPVTRLDLQRQFLALRDSLGKTAVFVTHDVREALLLATRIALMNHGTIEFLGSPSEFRKARTDEALAFLECLNPGMESS